MLTATPIDVDVVAASFPTIDAMEEELQRLEGLVARVRARQIEILAAIDNLQVAAWDGCRSLQEWIAGRLDMQPRNASDLAVLAKSESSHVHDSLRAGVAAVRDSYRAGQFDSGFIHKDARVVLEPEPPE